MKQYFKFITTIPLVAFVLFSNYVQAQSDADTWRTLFDGSDLDYFNVIGDANWKLVGDTVQADSSTVNSFLVTKESFGNFQLKLDFWVDSDANSGIFMRCSNPGEITDTSCYEANIYDKRPDPSGRTGAIVNVAEPAQFINAGGKWNTYLIVLDGSRLLVELNGLVTVDVQDDKLKRGPIALQYGRGTVKFRRVIISELDDS